MWYKIQKKSKIYELNSNKQLKQEEDPLVKGIHVVIVLVSLIECTFCIMH